MEAADAQDNVTSGFALHAAEANVTVALTPGWVPLLSEAMLGEPMQAPDDGAADLMQEVAAQGFGVVQTALAEDGVELPALRFAAAEPGEAVASLDGPYWRIPFAVQQDDPSLYGFALLPAETATEADAPAPSSETASAPASAAPSAGPSEPPNSADASSGSVDVAPASFADLGSENVGSGGDGGGPDNFELLAEVKLEVTVELGRRRLPLADVLKLTTGSVVELEKLVGEPLSVYANGRLIAEGEAVVIDEQFGVRITSLASKSRRDKAFF